MDMVNVVSILLEDVCTIGRRVPCITILEPLACLDKSTPKTFLLPGAVANLAASIGQELPYKTHRRLQVKVREKVKVRS